MIDCIKIGLNDEQPTLEFYPERGGILNALRLKAANGKVINVVKSIDDQDDLELNPTFKNIPLFPFPNRLDSGSYEHDGKKYCFPVNEADKNNSLHGFAFKEAYILENTEVSEQAVKTTLKYVYNGRFEYFPFPATVELVFIVKEERELEVIATVSNSGSKPMPFGFGWHPYFTLEEVVDSLLLQLPEVKRKSMNDRALPAGEEQVFTSFSSLAPIGDTFLDDCFVLSEPEKVAAVRLWSEKQSVGLEIWQEANGEQYQYIQVFTHPSRDRIAVEPMTCNVNAFQNKEGLKLLKPGESFRAKFGVRLISSLDD